MRRWRMDASQKINGNKVPCGIDLLSIKYHDLSLGGIHRRRKRLGRTIFER